MTKHFKDDEFRCHHCGALPEHGMSSKLLALLEDIREHYDAPVHITSGYRCPVHNKAVGGAVRSQHMLGTAADIKVVGVDPARVYADLDPTHEGGLGKYNTFTHVDVRNYRARWTG